MAVVQNFEGEMKLMYGSLFNIRWLMQARLLPVQGPWDLLACGPHIPLPFPFPPLPFLPLPWIRLLSLPSPYFPALIFLSPPCP